MDPVATVFCDYRRQVLKDISFAHWSQQSSITDDDAVTFILFCFKETLAC